MFPVLRGGAFPGQTSSGDQDVYVRKYDSAGDEVWTWQFGTSSSDAAYGNPSLDADGSIYVTGHTAGQFSGQPDTEMEDVFVAKLVQPAMVDTTEPEISGCEIHSIISTNPLGATAEYSVGVTDNLDPNPSVVYDPPSGSFLPVGTTTVSVTAWDLFGNTNTCQFPVAVRWSQVVAWGTNGYGQRDVPEDVSYAVATAAGGYHSLALRPDGTVAAWGGNDSGQCNVPADLTNAVAISAGVSFSMALRADGTVTAWGYNGSNQTNVPSGLSDVVAISAGWSHSLALKSDGTVAAWGVDYNGISTVPAGLSNVVAVAGCGEHSLALRSDGTVVAWGYNGYGQTNIPAGLTNVTAVAGGYTFGLAMKADGTVTAWGGNTVGQCTVPADLTNAVAISAKGAYSLALRSDRTVAAWGAYFNGTTYLPAYVPADLTNVLAVSAGPYFHNLAVVDIGLEDLNAPAIYGAEDRSVTLQGASGQTMDYMVRVFDDIDPAPTVTYDPPLGSWLPIGETTVTVTATDAAQNTSQSQFLVTVVDMTDEEGAYGGGSGTQIDPYRIHNVADWVEFMNATNDWDKHFILTTNLYFGGMALMPVGNSGTYFSGTFNGFGHFLRNAVVDRPTSSGVGVFGRVRFGGIRHLGIENIAVRGGDWSTGGLAGELTRGTIENCYVTGPVSGGGEVGGLVGWVQHSAITASYATGPVNGTNWNVGGLVGELYYSSIADSYATGSVSNSELFVGGLVGRQDYSTTVNSYATGPVSGGLDVGGLMGFSAGAITACYWNVQTSGQAASYGGGEGRTTDEMTSPYAANTYVGWDFAQIWAEDTQSQNGGYPYLRRPPIISGCADVVINCEDPAGVSVAYENHLNIIIHDDDDPTPTATFQPESGSVFMPGVTPVAVTAWDAAGNTNSCQFTVTIALPPVAAPATDIAGEGFTANWTASAAATNYLLDVALDDAFTRFVSGCQDLPVGDVLSWPVSGLSAGATYYYRVRAQNDGGTSGYSGGIEVLMLPGAPTAQVATDVAETGFTANWTAVSSAMGYWLDIATDSEFTSFVAGYQDLSVGDVLAWPVADLSAGSTYYYRVRAENPSGTGDSSTAMEVATVPDAPIAQEASGITETEFIANWQVSAGATAYRLDVAVDAGFNEFVDGFQNMSAGSQTTMRVSGLAPDATYYYRVRAENGSGTSGDSAAIEVQTVPDTTSPAIGNYSDLNVSTWDTNGVPVGYDVTVEDDIDPNPTVDYSHESGSIFPMGETTVTVTAWDASGNTNEITFTVTVGYTPVVAWGNNEGGQCDVPAGLSGVVRVAAGMGYGLALRADGTVASWGDDSNGQVSGASGVAEAVQLVAASANGMALHADGSVSVWGANFSGQCDVPADLTNAVKVAGCQYNLLALRNDGTLANWGLGGAGYLDVPGGLSGVVDIAAGEEFFVALKADGTVRAWGNDSDGQCSGAEGLTDIVQVAAGHYHGLGLKADGTVVAWGWNGDGACDVPPGLSNVVAIAGAENHSLALLADGSVVTWGNDDYGQCAVPARLAGVEDISAGTYFSLALVRETPVESDVAAPAIFGDEDRIVVTSNPNGALMACQVRVFDDTDPNPTVTYDPPLGSLLPINETTTIQVTATDASSNSTIRSFNVMVELAAPAEVVAWSYDEDGNPCVVPEGLSDVVAIAGGPRHNLALKANGTIVAWGGYNEYGECDVPAGLTNAVGIAASWDQSVALRADGTVVAWGWNDFGQCDLPAGLDNVVKIATSGSSAHILALRSDGTIAAWGYNEYGQCDVPAVADAIGVATGNGHSLALRADGTVLAWGDDDSGQCSGAEGLTDVVAIAAGGYHSLALLQNGTVVGWGNDDYGQCSGAEGLTDVVAIAAGWWHSLALLSNGTVVAWGIDEEEQQNIPAGLANVTAISSGSRHSLALIRTKSMEEDTTAPVIYGCDEPRIVTTPDPLGMATMACQVRVLDDIDARPVVTYDPPLGTSLPMGTNIVTVTAVDASGNTSSCEFTVIVKLAEVIAWGYDEYGQCSVPGGLVDVTAIAAGMWHGLALRSDGAVVAWGDNEAGQCSVPADMMSVVAIAAGQHHNLALQSDGSVRAWGNSDNGECDVPDDATNIVAIAAGVNHSLALRLDGTVISWGNNDYGQSAIPEGLTDVVAISAGWYYNLALRSDGTVEAWGQYDSEACSLPAGMTNVVAVSAGANHGLALLADGTVQAWGSNQYGESTVPDGLTDVVAIAAGSTHSMALKSDGTIEEWGDNPWGELNVPSGLPGATAIAAGGNYNLMLLGSGDEVDTTPPAIYGCENQIIPVLDPSAGTPYFHQVRVVDDTDPRPTVAYDPPLGSPIGAGTTPITVTAWDVSGNTNVCTFNVTVRQPEVWAWGNNESGQCNVPVDLSNVVAIASGSDHVLALKSDGTVVAWGSNEYGETDVPADLSGVTAIAAGSYFNLALLADGTVTAWGNMEDGRGEIPANATDVVAISAGDSHCLALKSDGTVVAWGATWNGECTVPADLGPATAISAGNSYSMALQADGTVRAWGANWNNQCNIDGLTGATAIFAGPQHSMALLTDGTVVAFGNPVDATAWSPRPGLTDVTAISAGAYHSMALKSDGSLELWGYDWGYGEISAPEMSGITAISAGPFHNVVLLGVGEDDPEDTTPPVISGGGEIHAVISPNGMDAVVDYGDWITATDDLDPNPVLTFDPASGSTLPVGTTTVAVTATDASANVSTGEFTVVVKVPGPAVNRSAMNVREGGEGRFFVRLDAPPAAGVVVTIARVDGDTNVWVKSGAVRAFTAANWNIWQAVTLAAGPDGNASDETATFRVALAGAEDAFVTATALDDDLGDNLALASGGATIRGVMASQSGRLIDGIHTNNANYGYAIWTNDPPGTITLDLKTAQEVTRVRLLNWDWTYRVHRYTLESSADGANWSLLADARAEDHQGWDDWAVSKQVLRYLRFTGLSNSANQGVLVSELEVYGERTPVATVEISRTAVNVREGGQGRFFIRLAGAPEQPVTFTVARSAGDESLAVVSGATLGFSTANWSIWQAVTLAQADDADADGEMATIRISAAGCEDQYVAATALDDDIGENVALASGGATIRGSKASSAGLLIDGVHNASANYGWTVWTNVTPGTMTLDLKAAMTVSRIRLLGWDWVHRTQGYQIESSTDGVNWTPLVDASAPRHGWDDWAVADASIRYLRFTGLSSTVNQAVLISELEVYGTRSGARRVPLALSGGTATSEPVMVLTSGGVKDETGWAAVDGDPETAWIGQKSGGGYLVIEYAPALTLKTLEVELAEGSLTNMVHLYSLDAEEWLPLAEALENGPVTLNYLWLLFPDDGTAAGPEIREIRTNP